MKRRIGGDLQNVHRQTFKSRGFTKCPQVNFKVEGIYSISAVKWQSVRDLLDVDDQGQGIFTPIKNKCPAEVNFDTNGTPYGIHCSVCVVKAREE